MSLNVENVNQEATSTYDCELVMTETTTDAQDKKPFKVVVESKQECNRGEQRVSEDADKWIIETLDEYCAVIDTEYCYKATHQIQTTKYGGYECVKKEITNGGNGGGSTNGGSEGDISVIIVLSTIVGVFIGLIGSIKLSTFFMNKKVKIIIVIVGLIVGFIFGLFVGNLLYSAVQWVKNALGGGLFG